MDEPSDEALLNLYFEGDAEAFQTFFRRHAGRVLGYAIGKGLRREIAQEVRQDAFLRLHRSIHTYQRGRPALPWFFTIVHNCVTDAQRQTKGLLGLRLRLAEERRTYSQGLAIGTADDSAVVLASLSEDQRRVFELRALNELSFAEIAVETGKSEVSLRKIFERARRKMQGMLAGEN